MSCRLFLPILDQMVWAWGSPCPIIAILSSESLLRTALLVLLIWCCDWFWGSSVSRTRECTVGATILSWFMLVLILSYSPIYIHLKWLVSSQDSTALGNGTWNRAAWTCESWTKRGYVDFAFIHCWISLWATWYCTTDGCSSLYLTSDIDIKLLYTIMTKWDHKNKCDLWLAQKHAAVWERPQIKATWQRTFVS